MTFQPQYPDLRESLQKLQLSKRFRGLVMGPDNALYAATDEGEIYRITAN